MDTLSKNPTFKERATFLRITDAWISALYTSKTNDFGACLTALQEMMKNLHDDASSGSSGGEDHYLRELVAHNLGLSIDPRREDAFPGPMANQLSRAKLQTIADNEYYITEKSDGIRVMMLHQFLPNFPRFQTRLFNNQATMWRTQSLYNTLLLEVAARKHASTVTLDGHDYIYRPRENKLILVSDQSYVLEVFRSRGWGFSYFFDRNYQFYLCTDRFVFIDNASVQLINQNILTGFTYIPLIIADGEIVENLQERRHNFTIFDLAKVGSTYFGDQPMSNRIAEILTLTTNHHIYHNKFHCTPYVLLKRKAFYPKHDLNSLLSHISPSPSDPNLFLYKGYNYNDGLVFTPNSASLYRFLPGRSDYLLKWKWPSRLSADFLVIPANDQSGDWFDLFFLIKAQHFFFRRTKFAPSTDVNTVRRLLNNRSGTIVECSIEVSENVLNVFEDIDQVLSNCALWKIDVIRDDKNHGNSFHVVTNTLETIVEGVNEDDLRQVALGVVTDTNASRLHFEQLENLLIDYNAFAHFKLVAHHKKPGIYHMDYAVQVSPTKVHWYFYLEFTKCLFENSDVESTVHEYLQNNPKCENTFVRCRFVPSIGQWKIVDMNGEETKCFAAQLLQFLEFNICMNEKLIRMQKSSDDASNRKRKTSEQSFTDEEQPPAKRLKTE